MKIMLAPMEGVVDNYMRETLTNIGGFDTCVTEFVRVVDDLLPRRVFLRLCPELNTGGYTSHGVPVIVQLLGSNPEAMAENARRAVVMGAPGIDLNFGCPARCVNKNNGGSVLLKDPQRLYDVVSTVRKAVDENIPVSAKIRLGFESTELAIDNALAVQAAGANYVVVHARTKADGYKHPARWEWLARINESLNIPVIANGDINSLQDYRQCLEISTCSDVMIGRGAIARPDLARQIRLHQQGITCEEYNWQQIQSIIFETASTMRQQVKDRYVIARVKQWLNMMKREYQEAKVCFDDIRRLTTFNELDEYFKPRMV